MIIDTHRHYWQVSRGDYDWLDQAPVQLRRDFLPGHFARESEHAGPMRSILVQAAPTEAETRFLFELAQEQNDIAGVIGWVDFEADNVDARIRTLVRDGQGKLVGLRPMAQDIADPDWLARPSLDAAFSSLQEHGLTFDALVNAAQWPALRRRLSREPDLRVILDHAGKPDIASAPFAQWAERMSALAAQTSVYCKYSGLLSQLAQGMPGSAVDPYVEHLFACFGPARLVWGSDWPVVTIGASFDGWLHMAQAHAAKLSPGREADIFHRNAVRFYGLDRAGDQPLNGSDS
jgi:L-fuconolactonase